MPHESAALVNCGPGPGTRVGNQLKPYEGFASYEALRQWVRQTQGVEVKDKTLYTLVRTRFKTKLKVARPSHTKTP